MIDFKDGFSSPQVVVEPPDPEHNGQILLFDSCVVLFHDLAASGSRKLLDGANSDDGGGVQHRGRDWRLLS